MPRSKTATDCDVFAVISLAPKRPVQPPPMMATSTGLRLVMREPRFLSPLSLFGAVQPILPRPANLVEVRWDLQQTEPNEFRRWRCRRIAPAQTPANASYYRSRPRRRPFGE